MSASPEKKQRVVDEAPVLFYGETKPNGWMSNFYPSAIACPSGAVCATMEHYFHFWKAMHFYDARAARAVIDAKTPKEAKACGRAVRGFVEAEWNDVRETYMLAGLRLKVRQHPEIAKALVATGTAPLGEAAPRDKVWGIGLGVERARAMDPALWPGRNLMGKAWETVRAELV